MNVSSRAAGQWVRATTLTSVVAEINDTTIVAGEFGATNASMTFTLQPHSGGYVLKADLTYPSLMWGPVVLISPSHDCVHVLISCGSMKCSLFHDP